MNLFLIGANGRTGRLVLDRALIRGHNVTAFVRKRDAIAVRDNLRIVVGDPLSAEDLAPALANHDAVISCLGQRSRQDAFLLRNAAAAALEAMAGADVHRYLVVSQGLLFPSRNPVIGLLRLILARLVADSSAMEALVRAGSVDWTIVRPPRLQDGGSARGYRALPGELPAGAWAMQRADLAIFLVDEAERWEHGKEIVGIA